MAEHMKIRVVVKDDDFRRLELDSGMPQTLTEFSRRVQEAFDIDRDFRIQYMDPDFNNEFMNVTSMEDIKDRSTIKLVYTSTVSHLDSSASASPFSSPLPTSPGEAASSSDSDGTIILPQSSPTLRSKPWPRDFPIPSFTYNVEVQLQRGNEAFKQTGARLQVSPGLKSAILEKLAENIFEYTAYPQVSQIDEVAEALIKKYPCLRENSATGYYAWMISLKYKMANFRTKLRNIDCPEVTVNALKNKSSVDCLPAKNVKKPKKAEVNYCPAHPVGETEASLEDLRTQLLNDIKQRNNAAKVREKMSTTFSYRRKEVVHNCPSVAEFKARWPALFTAEEINAEFQRVTTLPLEVTFFAELDQLTPQLTTIFEKKGGVCSQKMAKHLQVLKEVRNVFPSETVLKVSDTFMNVVGVLLNLNMMLC